MGVNSYAEIFTTVIGWHMYNVIWDVLVATGIVFLPFIGILIDHWRTAFVDGAEAGGASAGLRALEMDLYMALTVVVLAAMPTSLTTLNRSEVFYTPPATTANPAPVTATGVSPQSTFGDALGGTPAAVQVPVWWYAVMGVSAGLNSAIISGAGLTLDDLRKVVLAAKHAHIDDPQVRYEAQRFYGECFVPARTRFLREPASAAAAAAIETYGADDPEWMGSHALRDDPQLYAIMYARREVPGWPVDPVRDRDQATAPIPPIWGRPSCKEWWEGGEQIGLRAKLVGAALDTSELPNLVLMFGTSLTQERRADLVVQTLLDKTRLTVIPEGYAPVNRGAAAEAVASTAAMVAGFVTMFFTWLATSVLKPALPFVQCLLLMGVYMLLPFVMVLSRYSLSAIVVGAIAIFTIKMWSVLWFVTDYLDDRLVRAVYPNADSALSALASLFTIGDPTKAMLLNLVVMSMYLMLPALWSGLMTMVGIHVGTSLAAPTGMATEPIKSTGGSAGGVVTRVAGLGMRGISRGSRWLRERYGSGRRQG